MNSDAFEAFAPRYRLIGAKLWEDIQQGRMKPGDRLPTEVELSERFSVNRLTVRQAVAELQRLGAVEIHRGVGTFVTKPPDLVEVVYAVPKQDQTADSVIAGASQEDEPDHSAVPLRTVEEDYIASSPASGKEGALAAKEMNCDIKELIELDTLMIRNGIPWIYNSYWIDRRYQEIIDYVRSGEHVVRTLVEEMHLELHYVWRAFSAVAAGYEESRLLKVTLGTALLVRDGVTSDSDHHPVFYVRRRVLGETAKFVLRYREKA